MIGEKQHTVSLQTQGRMETKYQGVSRGHEKTLAEVWTTNIRRPLWSD